MKSLIITTLLIAFAVMNAFSQDISGVWHGTAKNPDNKEILFVFLFENTQNGLISTMGVPTFDVSGIKPKTTTFEEGVLRINGSNFGMKYKGVWNDAANQIEGTYTEGSVKLALTLKKGNPKMATANRPQEPTKPYPYYEEEVTFNNTEAGISLAGTFTRPNQKGKYPVVVLISGSGRHDRDGRMSRTCLFWCCRIILRVKASRYCVMTTVVLGNLLAISAKPQPLILHKMC